MSLLLLVLSHDFLIVSLIIHSPLRLFSINYSQFYAFSFSLEIKILEVEMREMKRINLVIFVLACMLNKIESADVTPTDACTDSRTKDYFCNDDVDCTGTSVIYCAGALASQAITFSCGNNSLCKVSESGDYCTGSCGGDVTIDDNPAFVCTGLGYYPNPYDCNSYYFCSLSSDKTEYTATLYNCPSGNVFSPTSATYCTRKNLIINNCITVNCGATNSSKYIQIQYGLNKQYYALCAPDATLSTPIIYIFVCPKNTLPSLNDKTPKCTYTCWRTGFFPNSLDSSKYFECYWNNWKLESMERRCPSGASFDATTSQCKVELRAMLAEIDDNQIQP
ncbi:uncharacterized protein [Chironomus tepperi]|uniref:uncharacterized protein n=1 Tax=Chironomus tepperi TaxID=113505 RepID=UPI00391FA441